MSKNEKICLELVKAESEQEVIQVLKAYKLWDEPANWQFFGGEENNFSVIGNQQSRPESAIVEKFINSVDAVLMAECLKRNIDPESASAPKSIRKALHDYFGVFEGKLTNITPAERSRLSEKIGFVATGSKRDPNYVIYDFGEGQSPARLSDTILSIRKSNKLRIPFVQGKFNMGGTGVFRFCGDYNIQLVISRRNPEVAAHETDPAKEKWGFTIIRREDPKQGMRSSSYKYLAPANQIMAFDAAALPILPLAHPQPYGKPMEYGTYLKMYNYKIGAGLRTVVTFNLFYKLSLLMPQLALPIKMYERRVGYSGHSFETILSGLSVRVEEDRSENVEDGFPTTGSMTVSGQSMKYSIYAFKRDKQKNYATDEGVIFTINGQTHGHLSKAFFSRQKVGMSYLQHSILVMLDCSDIEGRAREDLFMNSRDRLSNDTLRFEIEEELENLIKNHPGLRELKDKRRREDVENRLLDQKPLADVLKDILHTSPTLSKLFIMGQQLQNPFFTQPAAPAAVFVGKKFPSFFTLEKKFPEDKPKQAHLGSRFRVTYKTDVVNDYFDRPKDQGVFKAFINDVETTNVDVNLWNGFGYLNVNLTGYTIGNKLKIRTEAMDVSRTETITEEFYVIVMEQQQRTQPTTPPTRRRPSGPDDGAEETQPAGFALPAIIELSKDGRNGSHLWEEQGFDKNSALKVLGSEEDGYDFFLNIDNIHLRTEIRGAKPEDALSIEGKYKFGQVLLGLAMLKDATKLESSDPENPGMGIFELIEKSSQAWSPVIIPMIDNLSALDLSNEADTVLEEEL
jgi:hypothetical protein